jgi:hypothetical protein
MWQWMILWWEDDARLLRWAHYDHKGLYEKDAWRSGREDSKMVALKMQEAVKAKKIGDLQKL